MKANFITQDTCNKLIEINLWFGCMVWLWLCLFQYWTFVKYWWDNLSIPYNELPHSSSTSSSSVNMGVAWFYHAQSACQPSSETSVNSTNSSVITNPVDNNNRQPTNLKLQVNFYQTFFVPCHLNQNLNWKFFTSLSLFYLFKKLSSNISSERKND